MPIPVSWRYMSKDPEQPEEPSLWEQYLERKTLAAAAAERARETHRERREQDPEDEKARRDAQIERAEDVAYAREIRAAEIVFERLERERRGIDAESERRALAKERRDGAAYARDEGLAIAEGDRAEAVTSAARQAAETLKEHADEIATANDVTSAEYRTLVNTKVETAERMQEYRSEREIEQAKIDEERRGAAALMAQQARETRLLRELEDEQQPIAPVVDESEARALATLMGSSASKTNPAVDKPAMDQSEVRALVALMGSSVSKTNPAVDKPVVQAINELRKELSSDDVSRSSSEQGGFIRRILQGLRRVA